MSMVSSVKCTKEELQTFRIKVRCFLQSHNLKYTKITTSKSFNGEVRIYTGGVSQRLRLRMGRKLVAWRNHKGEIEGVNQEAIDTLKAKGEHASQLLETTNQPIPTNDYFSVYRVDDWEGEKRDIKEYFERANNA